MKYGRFTIASLCALFVFLPIVGIFILLINPPPDPWGMPLLSFGELIQAHKIGHLLFNSLSLSFLVSIFALFIGSYLAWLEHRYCYAGSKILHIMGLLPLAMPSYILAASLSQSLGPSGWIGRMFNWDRPVGFLPALLSLSLVTIPYVQLSIGSALRRCSAAEEEAAILLHQSPILRFKVSIWPYIRSAAAFSGLIAFLYAISDFGAVATMNLPVLTWSLYEAIRASDLRGASLIGVVLLVSTLPILIFAQSLAKASPQKHSVANPRQRSKKPLPSKQLLSCYLIHFFVIGMGLVFPILSMTHWVYEGWERGLNFASPWKPIADTLVVSSFGALVTVLFAITPAWEAVRNRKGKWFPLLSYIASALPGVLLAFGLMRVSLSVTSYTGGYSLLLASGLLLFVGYAMRFMAEAFGPLYSGIAQLDPRQEESAAILGASPQRWFHKIALPALKPNVSAAFLIAFLAILKELPVTLLLGGATGATTLAFRIWDRYEESLWHDAGLSGLILICSALLLCILTLRWRRYV